jgi:hypothetical protein
LLQLRNGFVLKLQRTSNSSGFPGGTPGERGVAMPYPAANIILKLIFDLIELSVQLYTGAEGAVGAV